MNETRYNCKEAARELAASASDPLPHRLRNHLEACPECRALARACGRMAAAGEQIKGAAPVPAEEDLLAMARNARARAEQRIRNQSTRRLPRWTAPALSASLSTAAVILAVGFMPQRPRSDTPQKIRETSRPAAAKTTVTRLSRALPQAFDPFVRNTLPPDLSALSRLAMPSGAVAAGPTGSSFKTRGARSGRVRAAPQPEARTGAIPDGGTRDAPKKKEVTP